MLRLSQERKPPAEGVVENAVEFNKMIRSDPYGFPIGNHFHSVFCFSGNYGFRLFDGMGGIGDESEDPLPLFH